MKKTTVQPQTRNKEATGREKVGEGAIRKRRTQEEIATKQKIAEDKDTKEKVEQRHMTEERNIKTGNTSTFSVLQEDNQEPILEEEKFLSIPKIDKEEKNSMGKGKREIGKIPKQKEKK